MDKSQIRVLRTVALTDPIFLDLSSGIDSPVHFVGQTLLERTDAEKIAELYSPSFPDYAISEETGLCHLPKLDLYAATRVVPNLLILIGEEHPDMDDIRAHYEMAEDLQNFAAGMGCRRFIACTTIRSQRAEEKFYVAATTSAEAFAITEKFGGKPFSLGRIPILSGPVLGLAKVRGFKALCIVTSLGNEIGDEETARVLCDYLVKVLELKMN